MLKLTHSTFQNLKNLQGRNPRPPLKGKRRYLARGGCGGEGRDGGRDGFNEGGEGEGEEGEGKGKEGKEAPGAVNPGYATGAK